MQQQLLQLAGLETYAVSPAGPPPLTVVLLHGYAMEPTDLTPFAHSMNLPAQFFFPRGPQTAQPRGRAWWDIDMAARKQALQRGARDLADEQPAGLAAARECLSAFLAAVVAQFQPQHLVLGGFSQGGMLACDWFLHTPVSLDALVLLSASRLNFSHWQAKCARLHNLPVFVSHGEHDADLAFTTGERLRDFLLSSGARVNWAPFDGGHEIPLPVWRQLRKFLTASLSDADGLLHSRPRDGA